MKPAKTETHPARGASLISLFAGVWLFLSPWIYGAYGNADSWNSWITGALIFLFALMRMTWPWETRLSWLNSILGIWIFISPWIYGYTGSAGRTVNSIIAGIIVFCAALIGANSQRMSHDTTSTL